MSPELVYGQYGAIFCLVVAVVHLYRENTAMRQTMLDTLKKYQERDEEERKWRVEQERKRSEARP